MNYSYQALNSEREKVIGEIDAPDLRSATRLLERQGLVPLDLSTKQKKQSSKMQFAVRQVDLRLAIEQLVTLLEAGVSLEESVSTLATAELHPAVALAFTEIQKKIRQGVSFSLALQASRLRFPPYIDQLVEAGEMTGKLADSMRDGIRQMAYDEEVRNDMRNAMIYPAILVVSGIGAVALIFTLVVPKFANLLDKGDNLPWLSWLVLNTGVFFNAHIWVMSSIAAILIGLLLASARQPALRGYFWNGLSRLPMFQAWMREMEIARWSGVLGILLGNNVAMLDAVELSGRGLKVPWLKARLQTVGRRIKGGLSMHDALKETHVFTATGLDMVRVGERAGQLPRMLGTLAKLYTDRGRTRTKRFLALLEPVAILLIGAMIGLLMAGVIMAVTSYNDIAL